MFSMIKIWTEVFWKEEPGGTAAEPRLPRTLGILMFAPVIVTVAIVAGLGVGAEIFFPIAFEAARQLIHPDAYIEAVLGAP